MDCIEVENVFKIYKSHGENVKVLDGMNLTVGYGQIFSLIGASGCGKTTLFTCLMGMQKIEKGEMRIFNQKVFHNKSSKNYHAIGYMPQQIALINELTIKETLQYFGDLYMMQSKELDRRILEVVNLLDLPNEDCQIRNLSGGQKRRVSLAVAILHRPKLLLLDEPTVGLDYQLREKIWNFLRESRDKFKITVVITTHYIDEAKNADQCGFMRNGKIIAQNSPANILAQLQCETLDEAFYRLSLKDEQHIEHLSKSVDEKIETENTKLNTDVGAFDRKSGKVIKALLRKEYHRIKRQPIEIFFLLIAPILGINLSINSFGTMRSDIRMGIVNNEIKGAEYCNGLSINCSRLVISCSFLQDLDQRMIKTYYHNFDAAYKDLKKENLKGLIVIPVNFSESFYDEVQASENIEVYLDYKNYIENVFMKMKIYEAYRNAVKKLAERCIDIDLQEEMITFEFLFGKMDFNFRKTYGVTSSFLMLFFIPLCYSSLLIYSHRLEGIWNRTLLSGVKISEFLLSHLLFSFVYSTIQSTSLVISIFYDLNVPFTIDDWVLVFIIFGMSTLGYVAGILTSASFNNFHMIYGFGVWLSFIMVVLCGFFWPTEAIHPAIKPVGDWSPITFAIKSFSNAFEKHMRISDPPVYSGLIYVITWIVGVLVILGVKLNRNKFAREV